MIPGRTIFAQLMDFLPAYEFHQCVPTIPWPLQNEKLFMLGSIPLHGLCPAHLSREPERYRSLSSVESIETLPHGYPRQSLSQYLGPCQRGSGLANLCRLRTDFDRPRQSPLCERSFWRGLGSSGLCSGFHHHRSLPVALSMGQVPQTQRRCQIAHASGFAWKYSFRVSLLPTAKFTMSIFSTISSWKPGAFYLIDRGLSRFHPALRNQSSHGLLYHKNQKKLPVQTSLFSPQSTNQ